MSESSVPSDYPAEDASSSIPSFTGAAAVLGVAGLSACAGFALTVTMAKKVDPVAFVKGFQLTNSREIRAHESGLRLASRALGWASLLAIGGTLGASYLVWKLVGAGNMQEFNMKMHSFFPCSWKVVSRDKSGTNIKSFAELEAYLLEKSQSK